MGSAVPSGATVTGEMSFPSRMSLAGEQLVPSEIPVAGETSFPSGMSSASEPHFPSLPAFVGGVPSAEENPFLADVPYSDTELRILFGIGM